MKARLIKDCGLAVALFAAGFSLHAAEAAKPLPADSRAGARAPEKAKATPLPADMQKLAEQLNVSRDKFIASQDALKAQLKNATDEKKKEILAQLEKERKDLLEQQRAIGKQIRDDMRKQRQNVATPPPR